MSDNSKARGDGGVYLRGNTWWCVYWLRGKRYRESTEETDEQKAKKFLRNRLKEIGADQIGAKPFVGPQQEKMTVNDLLDALETDYTLRGKLSPQVTSHLKRIREHFGERRAVGVASDKVDEFIKMSVAGDPTTGKRAYAPASVNRATQLLRQAYALGLRNKKLSPSVIPYIRHLDESDNVRSGFFGEEQFRSLLESLPEYLRDYCLFDYQCGWRKGEVISLKWESVEGDTVRLRGVDAKTGNPNIIVLFGEQIEILERRETARQYTKEDGTIARSEYVFHRDGSPVGDFRKAWQTACCAVGLGEMLHRVCMSPAATYAPCPKCGGEEKLAYTDLKYRGALVHDFRRTAARDMVRAGVPQTVAMRITGHKTNSMFMRYNIVDEEDLRDAMRRVQEYRKDKRRQAKVVPVSKRLQ